MIKPWIVLLSLLCLPAVAQQQVLTLNDDRFDVPLEFNVELPQSYQQNDHKRYVFHFDFHPLAHTYLTGNHLWMSHNGEWPWLESIIVTPKPGNPVGKLFDSSGKTTPLLDFFEQQLIPAIDKQFRTNGFRIISGFRVNGTLALSALIRKPELFNAYFVTSPELKDNYAGILQLLPQRLGDIKQRRMLIWSHGDTIKEVENQHAYEQFGATLAASAPASLDWHYRDYQGRYFMSLPVNTVIEGIELLYDDIHRGQEPTSALAQSGVDALVAHYQMLSEQKYGFEVSPKAAIRNLGLHELGHSAERAHQVFVEMQKLYPEDPYSAHYLARSFSVLGDNDNALMWQKRAVEMSQSLQSWHQKKIRQQLQQLNKSER